MNDGKGTQPYSYDLTTGDLTQIIDSGLGTLTATYNKDGQLVTQDLPGGLRQQTTYDESGQQTRISYTKTDLRSGHRPLHGRGPDRRWIGERL